jgi:hypothetical protein
MANKQIHELPPIDVKAFRPAQDNFIVQKPGGKTSRANIGKMIDDPSVDLPGSTDWNWKWLDTPATITPYHKINYSLPAFSNINLDQTEENLPSSIETGYPRLLNLSYEYDAVTRKPTGIPKNAKSLMCVAFLNNCDLHLVGSRGRPAVTSQRLRHTDVLTYGWNSNPVETVFIVDNVSRPKDFTINQNMPDKNIQYMEPNTLSFELRYRLAKTGYVQFGGSYILGDIAAGLGSIASGIYKGSKEIASGRFVSGLGTIARGAYTGADHFTLGALPTLNIGSHTIGVDIKETSLGRVLNAFSEISNVYQSGDSKSLDITNNPLTEGLSSLLSLPTDLFSSAANALGELVGKIPIIGPVIEPLLATREGFQLVLDQALMAKLLSDPGFFYDTFIKRSPLVETSYLKEVAGWELFYIKVLAWN